MATRSLLGSCIGKRKYGTFNGAEQVRVKCMEHRPLPKLRAYLCDYCECWHLTSQPTLVERVEQEQAAASPAPSIKAPTPAAMVDVTCAGCRHRFGFAGLPENKQVPCPKCGRHVRLQPIRAMLANVRLCQEQSEVAFRLRTYRSEMGLSTAAIAHGLGVATDFLRSWLDGAMPMAPAQLERVHAFLGDTQ